MDTFALIVNKKAYNVVLISRYTAALDQQGISYRLLKCSPCDLEKKILECIDQNFSSFLIGGGDGTVRSAAQLCASRSVRLGVLPLGTLNHLATELGLPDSPERLVEAIKSNHTISIDVAEVNGLKFLNNSSIGIYPRFAKKRDHYSKFVNKWFSYVYGFIEIFKHKEVYNISIKSKDFDYQIATEFCMVSNNLYSYHFPATLQRESFQKGLLGLYFYKSGKMNCRKLLHGFFNQKKTFKLEQSCHPIEVRLINDKPVLISLDGETMHLDSPLKYTVHPRSLTFITDQT